MKRTILHIDANGFYASVEALYRPEARNRPLSVCGDPEARHGIVLASNTYAKKCGVKTGMAIWQARQICPGLVAVPPDFPLYVHFSKMLREIYESYSDRVESFGLDECWADLTNPDITIRDGEHYAHEIRERVKRELGITVSVGVSDNKIFAKLGSDLKKPDAVTVIPPEGFKEKIWSLPACELLYVGPKTTKKLRECRIYSIGDLACAPSELLKSRLGKNGLMLQAFANGYDSAPVKPTAVEEAIKSVGNSTTTPVDIATLEDARCVYYLLAESVGMRLRENGFRCRCVNISVRTTDLRTYSCQLALDAPTNITGNIAQVACALFEARFLPLLPLRSVGVSCSMLSMDTEPLQLDMLGNHEKQMKMERLDAAIDEIRRRYGTHVIRRGVVLSGREFSHINPKDDHTIHPMPFFGG